MAISKPRVFQSGLNRRQVLKTAGGVMACLLATKPSFANLSSNKYQRSGQNQVLFDQIQQATLIAVQQQLFPNDGDGPSAAQLHAFEYLTWALAEPDNQQDGDFEYIVKGIGWLEEEATALFNQAFIELDQQQQRQTLEQLQTYQGGENWMSILVYYLLEALTLDPIYGGNPNGIGWDWLQHQAGQPRPDPSQAYWRYE